MVLHEFSIRGFKSLEQAMSILSPLKLYGVETHGRSLILCMVEPDDLANFFISVSAIEAFGGNQLLSVNYTV